MKKFTVKDFIAYNNPCFSCGSPINFRVGFLDLETKADVSYLRPVVTPNHTEIDLIIKYSTNEALKLCIFHKTNKIFVGSTRNFKTLNGIKFMLDTNSYTTCKELQKDWNQYGKDEFTFDILEILNKNNNNPYFNEKEALLELEEKWLEKLQPYGEKGYNIK